ncbi:DUF4082 domain-containing protein [Citricoccus parietis]|uniref:DUF4082 domain-containing protein n=2 Tax=Citricoccus parietis TaxID=592307 RepID=A0ABV6F3C9_9MICC
MVLALLASVALFLPFAMAPGVQAAGPCGPDSNPIVCENSKAGAHWSEWEIDGAGDESIQGFATDMSVNAGQTIDFKIDTDASDYDIDIYRTGWYQGLGARKVGSVQPSAALPQNQDECLTDPTTELTDCGTWAVSASWQVPADAVSGVYLAKLTRTDTGGASHITFVVRNDGSTSEVLFQTSDTTWHAYNSYGGSNFYQGADNGRAYKISYNRPFATRGGIEARDFYFGSEYPMVRFMERNGYDVSYFSGIDTDRFGDQLTNHEVFLSVGHDEYWSGQQRANVEAARDAGVHLQFLSGNEMYWRVRYEPSPADQGGGDHRTLVSYKETWSDDKIDPAQEWTGTFRDPRFAAVQDGGGVPENTLTGTAYVVNYGDFPVTVDDREGDLRLWRDTGLEDLPTGSSEELAPHTVGYESNEDLLNGFRPPGLIRLSTTTGSVPEYLQDFGNTVAPGETTHHVTLYQAPSGALVFSAGSVQWTWGLDEWHDGDGEAADPRMQQAQVNLFADMGVQPTTLMDGLVPATASADTTAPTVQVTEQPTEPVPHGQPVTVSGTATDGTGAGAGVVAGVEYSLDAGSTWAPAEGTTNWSVSYLQPGMGDHTVLVRAIDDSANYPAETADAAAVTIAVEGPYSTFGERTPKLPDSGDPAGVELGLRFSPTVDGQVTGVRFYGAAANSGAHTGTLWSLDGTALATVAFPASTGEGWRTAELSEPVAISAGTDYVVSYTAPQGRYAADSHAFAYRGVDGPPLSVAGGFGAPAAGVFAAPGEYPSTAWYNTNYYVDVLFVPEAESPLAARSQQPANTAASVPVDTPISAVLSREIDPDSLAMTVSAAGSATPVAGTASYAPATRTVTFTPESPLAEGTEHTVSLAAADTAGESLAHGGTWTFRTWSTTTGTAPYGLLAETMVPETALVDDGVSVTLGTAFTVTEAGTVSALEFYRAPGNTGPHTGTLYAADGTVLATADFPDDSVSGWQQAALAAPVRIVPGTEYTVAYTTPSKYSLTAGHWAQPRTSGSLRTSENAGRYTYQGGMPTEAVSTDYLVDVHFTPDPTAPTITDRSPAPGALDVDPSSTVTVTFDQAVHPDAAVTVAVGGSTGGTEAGTPVTGAASRTKDGTGLSFNPADPLPTGSLVTVSVTGATDAAGSFEAPVHTWSFRTALPTGETASFLDDAAPETLVSGDGAAVELGMAVTTDRDITVHALRYYRGTEPGSAGTGSVWDSDGDRIAHVAFPAGTAPGWYTAFLDAPVHLTAGSTFTVSRHAPDGGYAHTSGDFAQPRTVGALTLAGDNGLFRYGDGSASPNETWDSTNYFVDLLYAEAAAAPLSATSHQPADGAARVPVDARISAVFSGEPVPDTVEVSVTAAASEEPVAGSTEYETATRTVTFTPEGPLAGSTTYTVTVAAEDASGTSISRGHQWSFQTALADGAATSFLNDSTPSSLASGETDPVELGVALATDRDITVHALRYYHGTDPGAAGTGSIWDADGTRLARAAFPPATAPGWQTVFLETPVQMAAGTTFTVSRYSPQGGYPHTPGDFATSRTVGALTPAGENGLFRYGDGTAVPDQTWENANYFVDLLYTED